MFHSDLLSQRMPGQAGFAEFDATIVSPELPCGASWLASCLLELGAPLLKPWGINDRDHWQPLGGLRYRYECPGSSWSRLVPGLVHGREFVWRRSPVPRFTHTWPGWHPSTSRLIVFVRDPRDALRSDWLRHRRAGYIDSSMGLQEFTESPAPGLPMPRRDGLVLFLSAWRHALACSPSALILRFEDYKLNASATLNRALGYLGLRSDRKAREAALRMSDYAQVVNAERRLLAAGTVPTALLGEGRAFAWRDAPPDQQVTPDPAMARVCHWLGYRVEEVGECRDVAPVEQVISALVPEGVAEPGLLSSVLAEAGLPKV
ncbi:MAG: hypothetical protein ACNA7J_05365 [Wenzhouxiangella sp.]